MSVIINIHFDKYLFPDHKTDFSVQQTYLVFILLTADKTDVSSKTIGAVVCSSALGISSGVQLIGILTNYVTDSTC